MLKDKQAKASHHNIILTREGNGIIILRCGQSGDITLESKLFIVLENCLLCSVKVGS